MNEFIKLVEALGGKKSGDGEFMCHCPAHDDKHPSLSLSQADNGRILYNCFAGCKQEDVRFALVKRGLLSPSQNSGVSNHHKNKRNQHSKVKEEQHQESAAIAQKIWEAAESIRDGHPYLQRKQVEPTENIREIDLCRLAQIIGYIPAANGKKLDGSRVLVIPIRIDDRISTIEFISIGGRKSSLKAGKKAGGYWATGSLPAQGSGTETILIGEGVATVLSCISATGCFGIAALSNSNLISVSRQIRKQYPRAPIVLLADLEKKTGVPDHNAVVAAENIKANLAIPDFGKDRAPDKTDFNDLYIARGPDVVRECIKAAEPPSCKQQSKNVEPELILVSAAEIKPEPINWIWPDYLARGKLHVIAGPPGTGKTTISIHIAALISAGLKFPDGSISKPGNVIIWSGEDMPEDTLIPRLLSMGGNPKRVFFVSGLNRDDRVEAFDPSQHMPLLSKAIEKLGSIDLLIIDPVVSAVSGDSHKNAEVRRSLQPIVDLGRLHDAAVIGISHFSKGTAGLNPVERVTGSIAFGALARIVFATVKVTQADEEKWLFTKSKTNISPDGGGFYYEITQKQCHGYDFFASCIRWIGPAKGDARSLLAGAENVIHGNNQVLGEVKEWLRGILGEKGPLPAREILDLALKNGYSRSTVQRAREDVGVVHRLEGFGSEKKSVWSLPLSDEFTTPKCSDPEIYDERKSVYLSKSKVSSIHTRDEKPEMHAGTYGAEKNRQMLLPGIYDQAQMNKEARPDPKPISSKDSGKRDPGTNGNGASGKHEVRI